MTLQEFSNEFDVLYNNIMSNAAPGLNEYEKSLFLTKAQNELILNYFSQKRNKYGEGFDDSSIRQSEFTNLIKVVEVTTHTTGLFNPRGLLFTLPNDFLLSVNESFKCTSGTFVVQVITNSQYDFLMQKSFPEPTKRQVWKLIHNDTGSKIEIIPHSYDILTTSSYVLRYIKKPAPIILVALNSIGATIEGVSTTSNCELNSILHPQIVNRAVELAKAAYIGDITTMVKVNERAE